MGIIHYPKWFDVICRIDDLELNDSRRNYLGRLRRQIDIAGSHLKNCLYTLEEHGLLLRELRKKRKHITLTNKGRDVALKIRQLRTSMQTEAIP